MLLEEGRIFDCMEVEQKHVHVNWCRKEEEELTKLQEDPSFEKSLQTKQAESGVPVLENVRKHEAYLARTIASFAREHCKFKDNLEEEPEPEKVEAVFKPKNMAVEEVREKVLYDFFKSTPRSCENCQARSPALRSDPQCTKIFKTMSATSKKYNQMKKVLVAPKEGENKEEEEEETKGKDKDKEQKNIPDTKQKLWLPLRLGSIFAFYLNTTNMPWILYGDLSNYKTALVSKKLIQMLSLSKSLQ